MVQLSRLLLLVFASVVNVSSAAPAGVRVVRPERQNLRRKPHEVPDLRKNRTPASLRGAEGTQQGALHRSWFSLWPRGQLKSWTPVQRESRLPLYHGSQIQSRPPQVQQKPLGFRVPLLRVGLDKKKNGGRIQKSGTNRIRPPGSQGLDIGAEGKPKTPNLQVNIFLPFHPVTMYNIKDHRTHQEPLTPAGFLQNIQTNWQSGPESQSEGLWTPGDVVQQFQGHPPIQPQYPENKPTTSPGLQDRPAPTPRPGPVEVPRQYVPSFPNPALLNRYISKPALSKYQDSSNSPADQDQRELNTGPQYPTQVHHPQPQPQGHRVHTNTVVQPSGSRPWKPVTLDLHSLTEPTDFSPEVQNQDSVSPPKPEEPEPAPPQHQHPGLVSTAPSLGPYQVYYSAGPLNPTPEDQTPPRIYGLGRRPTYTKLLLDVDHVPGQEDVPHEIPSTGNDQLVHGAFPTSSDSQ